MDILDTFLIPSIERMFGNDEIIFQDDNASCHRAKTVKTFLEERHIRSMSWPANSPDVNPIENLWWKLKKMVHDKAPTCKADLAKQSDKVGARLMKSTVCHSLSPCLRDCKLLEKPEVVQQSTSGVLKCSFVCLFFMIVCFSCL